jgi:FkbM family methyltransferase
MKTLHKLAIARWAFHCLAAARAMAGLEPRTRVRRGGILWDLDLREAIDLSIYLVGSFEVNLAHRLVRLARPGHVVVDVGANIGAHTLPLARAVGDTGVVLAYEPSAFGFGKLQANLALNPDLGARVSSFQVMLMGRRDAAVPDALYASWPLQSPGSVHPDHGGRAVPTAGATATTLDVHLQELGVRRVDLVKLDVDGHECDVLAGAARTLERDRPVLVMEWAPYCHADLGHRLEECLAVPRAIGYRFEDAIGGRPIPDDLAALSSRIGRGASWNVIGRVPGRSTST